MSSDTGAMIALGFIALLILFIGLRRGFFHYEKKPWIVPVNLFQLLGAFAIYFFTTALLSSLGKLWVKKSIVGNYLGLLSWLSFGVSVAIALLLGIYLIILPKAVRQGILRQEETHVSFTQDFRMAVYAWILSFPLVLFLSQFLEMLVRKIFGLSSLPDQLAVQFLKSTFNSPIYFVLAVFSIIILAPLIEETLFRGFLQTFIRKHLGSRQAMILTSLCFALFHYAAGQGVGNIMIILSLFVLSLFLCFLYEKQKSLLAPMFLHALFNSISVINLYLFGGFTTGL